MKRSIILATFILAGAAGLLFSATLSHSAGGEVNAQTVAEHMNKSKYASAEIKSYLKNLKGKEITADGKINNILTGRTGTRVVVYVDIPGRSTYFIVDVYVKNSSGLHKNDRVSCKGTYSKYNWFSLNGITLKEGSCSK